MPDPLDVYTWFICRRIVGGRCVMFVSADAPAWAVICKSRLVRQEHIEGMYRLRPSEMVGMAISPP